MNLSYYLKKGSIYGVPVLHYTMELAMHVKCAFDAIQPDCVAVELPEPFQDTFLRAASRLPDISIIQRDKNFYMCEPCDAALEGLRCAIENGRSAYCIDLDVDDYPLYREAFPDPYSIVHIGLSAYYNAYLKSVKGAPKGLLDNRRELYMARRLKELSLHYDKILYVGGFYHIARVLELTSQNAFEVFEHARRDAIRIATLTEDACRDVMAEYGWISCAYELWRASSSKELLDRQKLIYLLYKTAAERYQENTGNSFLRYHLHNTMKFVRNYALIHNRLMPDLFEVLSAAKGCVDHNYAYETWYLATSFCHRKNIDNLEELDLTVEQVWAHSKLIQFHLKQKRRKGYDFHKRKKDDPAISFRSPSSFSICSYPPEDIVIECFGEFLKKKSNVLLSDEGMRTLPFTTSLEEGIDARETIRHLHKRQLFVKVKGRPPQAAGSVVVIFNEDAHEESAPFVEKYPWKTTWHGEHNQESDMAFYSTSLLHNVVGPGISRCEYGGFMMSYPPRRLMDVWHDPDYNGCSTKAEVLLMAAVDYTLKPIIVYVADRPPRSKMKSFANRFGKKIIYIPIRQLSPIMLNKIRVFHVLDGHDKREIAGDYIF
jgi:hypothetical protein